MSPTIRSKGGLPLMIGGLVAGSQECCCENPPPPVCWCPDYCQYKIQIVSPQECRASSRYMCNDSFVTTFTEPSLIQSVLDPFDGVIDCPGEVSGSGGAPCGNYGLAGMNNYFMESIGLQAGAYTVIAKRREYGVFEGAIASIAFDARVFCLLPSTTGAEKPQIFLQLDLRARVTNNDSSLGDMFFYYRSARKTVRIDQENCEMAGRRRCVYLNDPDRRIANFQSPLEFTLSIATTSFGDYEEDELSGREFGPYQDVLDSLTSAGVEATFRITSRPNCDPPVDCSCNAPLGGMYVTFGNLSNFPDGFRPAVLLNSSVGGEYDINMGSTERIFWSGPFGLYEYDKYDQDGPQDNTGKYTRLLWRQRVEIACDVIDGVDQWLVFFTSFRRIYDEDGNATHDSYDEWIGKIDCYKACEDLDNYIDADESVPMGEPYDIEYIGRTTLNGRLECEPPSYATISLSQIYTC